jgi:hypothetical protein
MSSFQHNPHYQAQVDEHRRDRSSGAKAVTVRVLHVEADGRRMTKVRNSMSSEDETRGGGGGLPELPPHGRSFHWDQSAHARAMSPVRAVTPCTVPSRRVEGAPFARPTEVCLTCHIEKRAD